MRLIVPLALAVCVAGCGNDTPAEPPTVADPPTAETPAPATVAEPAPAPSYERATTEQLDTIALALYDGFTINGERAWQTPHPSEEGAHYVVVRVRKAGADVFSSWSDWGAWYIGLNGGPIYGANNVAHDAAEWPYHQNTWEIAWCSSGPCSALMRFAATQ